MLTWCLLPSSVDQVANVVLYSNDSYVKCVAIEETGCVFFCRHLLGHMIVAEGLASMLEMV